MGIEASRIMEGASQGWNYCKTGHLKKNYGAPRKNEDKNDAANVVTNEVQDALILSVDDLYDS